jgi:hypothetical protein
MKFQPVLIALTFLNLAILGVTAVRPQAAAAPTADGILRGRGLQITDDKGKVRASISIMPAEKLKDGSTYPETVLLRLITDQGRPSVKISALTDGSGMSLADGQGESYVQILARGDNPRINIIGKDGKPASQLP